MTPYERNLKENQYHYLLEQQQIRPLQDYELDEISKLEKELYEND